MKPGPLPPGMRSRPRGHAEQQTPSGEGADDALAGDEERAAEFSSYATTSLEEAHDAIAAHYYNLRLEVAGPAARFATRLDVVELGALTVGDVRFGTEMRMSFGEPGVYHVAVPFSGCFSIQEGGGRVEVSTPGRALVFDPGRDIRVDTWSADCQALTVKIDKVAVLRQLEVLLGRSVSRPPRFGPYLDVSRGPGLSWMRLAMWNLLERDVAHGLLSRPMIRGRLEQTLLEGMLLATDHTFREALEAPPPPMRPASVKRVMDAVQELPAEPYDANRLAAIGQVGLRTLQEAFRRHVGMSPMAYVHEVRLQRVHRQLRAAAPGTTTVTDVAHAWGFVHLGRFARRYRERFGESPSQTLRSV
ncbi:Virulence regulon transcriptional activator VirF [Streptomyces griseorubiginosus]|uniref:Virulence regulon transcriptional activator VirF n=1 Tax=Streptomyces griseorubiginosus TaxID=67304 RepID=A0AAI8L8E5_9ACTN|nr:Virulence regulon transcriptional activator VirF [Streptomyces griseorubiginosus]